MATAKTQLQVRIDSRTKKAVRSILSDMGIDLSTAVNMFFKQIERTQKLPFDFGQCSHSHVFSPQKIRTLRKALNESTRQGKRFTSVQALMKDLHA